MGKLNFELLSPTSRPVENLKIRRSTSANKNLKKIYLNFSGRKLIRTTCI